MSRCDLMIISSFASSTHLWQRPCSNPSLIPLFRGIFKLNLHHCTASTTKTMTSANSWEHPDANFTWGTTFLLSDRLHSGWISPPEVFSQDGKVLRSRGASHGLRCRFLFPCCSDSSFALTSTLTWCPSVTLQSLRFTQCPDGQHTARQLCWIWTSILQKSLRNSTEMWLSSHCWEIFQHSELVRATH